MIIRTFLPGAHDFPFFPTFKDVLRMELHCLWKVDYLKNKSTLLMINLKQVTEAGGALVGGQEDKGDKGDRVDRGDRQGRQGRRSLLLCFVLFSIMLGCISGACSSICQGNLSKQLPTAISGVTLPLSNPASTTPNVQMFPSSFVSWELEMYSH